MAAVEEGAIQMKHKRCVAICHMMLTTNLEQVLRELRKIGGYRVIFFKYTDCMLAALTMEDSRCTVRLPRAVPSLP